MTTYLLNSPVLTNFGDYRYEPIDVDAARDILAAGFTSAIGHAPTAAALQTLFGLPVAFDRTQITMQPGDRAIVFRLKTRPAYGTELTVEELLESYELGLLTGSNKSLCCESQSDENSVFISYDRDNLKLAQQLYIDLRRAGIEAWRDQERPNRAADSNFEQTLLDNVKRCKHFVMLSTVESRNSPPGGLIKKELQTARESSRNIVFLRASGDNQAWPGDLPNRELTDFKDRSYALSLTDLISHLSPRSNPPRHLVELLGDPSITAIDAAEELYRDQCENSRLPLPHKLSANGIPYFQLPLWPTAYTMAWLCIPVDATLKMPDQISFLIKCTGERGGRSTLTQVIEHATALGQSGWTMYLEAFTPKEKTAQKATDGAPPEFWLPPQELHIWRDALEAALRCLQAPPFHQRILNMYFDCPIAFAFQLGNRNKNMGHQAVWHFERGKGYFNVTS